MSIIFLLLGISLFLALGFFGSFIWNTLNGQWDDLETPAHRILLSIEIKPSEGDRSNESKT
jgi:cbb3-type cytochrome oxidase maturation protein